MIDDTSGPAFPFRIDPQTGGVAWASGADKIRQNVRIILGTRIGERPMLRSFGCQIAGMVQEPNDQILAKLAETQIQQALLQFEPRILVLGVDTQTSEGELSVRVTYTQSDAPVTGELVVPVR